MKKILILSTILYSSCTSNYFKTSRIDPAENRDSWLYYVKYRMPANQRNIMPYKNIHAGEAALAGIEVYQIPIVDNAAEDYSNYIGKHPGAVIYHFWDGRIHWLHYSPDGSLIEETWMNHPSNKTEADKNRGYVFSWEMVDFSKGSDPMFLKNKDPRNPVGHGLFP